MNRAVLTVSALSLLMTGCANMIDVKKDVDADGARIQERVESAASKMPGTSMGKDKLLYTTALPGAYMGEIKKVPKKTSLPEAFNTEITMKFPDKPSLSTFAERLSKVTGIPVKLRPDAFMSASAFAPKSGGGAAPATNGPATPPPGVVTQGLNNNSLLAAAPPGDYNSEIPLNYHGTLENFLNSVTSRTGLNWEFKDGAIVFSRLVTRTFTMKSLPGGSELKSSVGKSGGSQVGSGSSFSSDSSIKMGSTFSVWDSLGTTVNSMMTGAGKVAVSEATGTITVTDIKDVVDQVGEMLEQINKSLSRQVAFRVEVLSLTTTDGANYGVNWNAVFNQMLSTNPSWKLALSSPNSLTGSEAGSLGYSVLTPATDPSRRGALSGSQAMLAAMASFGKATVVTTASALTLNRQPVPVAITDQISYVASVSTQASTNPGITTATTVQVTPGTVTTGFILNMLPAITDDNTVMLQFSVDVSMLSKMGSFGSGETAIQTPEVSGMQFLQRVAMKNGETLVLSGFERTTGQYDRRTMTKDTDLLTGGSLAGNRTKESIVIMITPVISEGA